MADTPEAVGQRVLTHSVTCFRLQDAIRDPCQWCAAPRDNHRGTTTDAVRRALRPWVDEMESEKWAAHTLARMTEDVMNALQEQEKT